MSEPHPLLSASLHTWEHCNTPRFTGIAIDSIDSIDYHTAKQALAQTCRSHPFGTIRAADRHLRFPKNLGLWSSQTESREAKKSEGKLHCCMKCIAEICRAWFLERNGHRHQRPGLQTANTGVGCKWPGLPATGFPATKNNYMGVSENVVYPIVPNGFADHYPY